MSNRKITIFHNPSCSKSRETMSLLEENNQIPEVVEYLKEPPGKQSLKEIIAKLGLPIRELIRTTEPVFAETGLDINSMAEDDIIDAICKHPSLLQRPIVVCGEKAIIGRPPVKVLDLL